MIYPCMDIASVKLFYFILATALVDAFPLEFLLQLNALIFNSHFR